MANFNVIVDETKNQVIVNEDAQSIVIRSQGTIGPQGDAGIGVPTGGTTGQVLAKNSNTDFDTEWVDQTGGSGGGVTDHGALTGLSDDDHTQYHNDARGDARYYTKTLSDAAYEPKNSNIQAHIVDTANPHNVTAAQVGLSEVDNTADVDKPISSATQTALDDKADDSAVVHKTGDETVAGLKQFDNSFTDDQPHEGTDFYLTHTATAPVSNGSTVGIRNSVAVDGDFDRTSWLDSARQDQLEIDGTGDYELAIGALTQVTQLGSGVVDLAAGQIAGVYCDNPVATINRAAGLIGSVEAVQGTITEANGVIGEVARQVGATIDKAIAFKVSDTVQGTDTYGFYNQTAGAKNRFTRTEIIDNLANGVGLNILETSLLVNATANVTDQLGVGGSGAVYIQDNFNHITSSYAGFGGEVHHTGGGSVAYAIGLKGSSILENVAGTGSIDIAAGNYSNVENASAGTINTGYAVLSEVLITGAGTITDGYALFCNTLQATNKYGVHIDVAGSVNVLREIQVKAESQVKFYDSDSSNYVGIKSPSALTGDRTATLQDASGTIAYLSDVAAKFTLPSLTSGSILFSDGTTISQDNTNLFWNNTTKRLGIGTASPASNLSVIQPVSTTGSPSAVTFTGGAHTTLTAATEATDILFDLARTVQFATGTIAFQRAIRINAPTYSSVGASTITEAATISISGPPIKGTNATASNAYGLYIGAAAIGAQTFGAGLSCFAPTGPATAYAAIFSGGTGGSSVRVNGGLELVNGSGYEINFTGAGNSNINVANSGSELQFSTNNAGMYFSTNTLSTFAMNISTANRVRISGTSAATALLHISAGTATASTAPLKFTSGTNLTTAEAGAMEYNGADLFFTKSGTTRGTVVVGTAVTTEVIVSDTSVTVTINGTTYKLLARA